MKVKAKLLLNIVWYILILHVEEQYDGISDFMPQFFMVRGVAATFTRMFSDTKITNEYTSEQCLGDEFMKHVPGNFKDSAYIISTNAYDYSDGIVYQVRVS